MDEALLRKFHKELSAGTVSLALLAVVAADSEPMYGYQIAKQLEQKGDGVLAGKQSALYPVLRNLETAGLLDSFVEPSGSGPPRRYYRVTSAGRQALLYACALLPVSLLPSMIGVSGRVRPCPANRFWPSCMYRTG